MKVVITEEAVNGEVTKSSVTIDKTDSELNEDDGEEDGCGFVRPGPIIYCPFRSILATLFGLRW